MTGIVGQNEDQGPETVIPLTLTQAEALAVRIIDRLPDDVRVKLLELIDNGKA